jgi:hypothetical protein
MAINLPPSASDTESNIGQIGSRGINTKDRDTLTVSALPAGISKISGIARVL